MITERYILSILAVCLMLVTLTRTQQGQLPEDLQGNPCSHTSSIKLPTSNKCLVLVNDAMTWAGAQATCERAGGSLYKMPSASLYSRPELMDCLSANNASEYSDLWLNGFSLWLPQFFWTNSPQPGNILNEVTYCPTEMPPTSKAPITSDYLSVDYCVSTCHDQGARFTVVYSTRETPKCNCIYGLESKYMVPCDSPIYPYKDNSRYYIVHSKENSLIKVGSANTFSSTEIMCATVDSNTIVEREMKSDTCFTQRPFLCELGTADECKAAKAKLQCIGTECLFICNNKCLKRVSFSYNWYAARSFCASLGGDLWKMNDLDDMTQVARFLDVQSRYWIGATNYAWNFNASSKGFGDLTTVSDKLRCGHMLKEKTTGSIGRTWSWSDASCTQKKSFLCQFEDRDFSSSQRSQNVSCPWVYVPGISTTTLVPLPQPAPVVKDSSFPLAAVIAGIIAGLILLTCLGLAFAFCGRRHWHKVREHLTFIPYFSDNSHVVMGNSHEFENMSQVGRSHMSSVSEHGSQTGLVKGGYSSYQMEQSGMYSSKSLDRRTMESMGHKLADSQNYLASVNNSMDERGFATTYSTMPSKQKEYMTLQAQMDIQDEAQLAAMRQSLRGKPEMTLVTDHADMNVTINHANTTNGHLLTTGNGGAGSASLVTDRVLEEVTVPVSEGGVILTFPERVQEAHIYTGTTGPAQMHQINIM